MCTFEPVYFFGDSCSIKSSKLHDDYDNYGIEVSIVEKEDKFTSVPVSNFSCQCENSSNYLDNNFDYASLYPSLMKDYYYGFGTGKSNFKELLNMTKLIIVEKKENKQKMKSGAEKLDKWFDKIYTNKESKNFTLKFMANSMYGSNNSDPSQFTNTWNMLHGQSYEKMARNCYQKSVTKSPPKNILQDLINDEKKKKKEKKMAYKYQSKYYKGKKY